MLDDEKLYRAYLCGDNDAAAELVKRYGDSLTLYINGYIRDSFEAEDLMIEAFSLLFVKERPIKDAGCFKAYLYKTARNLSIRHKSKRRCTLISLDALEFEPQSESEILSHLEADERHRMLYESMNEMKKEYREVIYLIYFEDMSYSQAATVLGKTESQCTNLIYRGKKQLKSILERKGFIYENY